jgi:phospholipase C
MRRKLVARKHVAYLTSTAMVANLLAPVAAFAAASENTLTPIKHLIIIIGENRSFDHVFATYKPVNKGEKVLNLLRKESSMPMARRARITAPPCNTRHSTSRRST